MFDPVAQGAMSAQVVEVSASLTQLAHNLGRTFTDSITRDEQKAAGQFMTPPAIALFMARRLVSQTTQSHIRLLEPSAGGGILVAAVVEALLEKPERPATIEALLYEQDIRLIPSLSMLCQRIKEVCENAGVHFDFIINCEDFLLSKLALSGIPIDGLLTIANPPFFKLNKATDPRARLHDYAVYGQPNVYGLFMAATARLTSSNGRWCFITPRSWMNGQYFRAVRHTILSNLMVDRLHAFESRRDSFEEDAVLQETVIAWATGRAVREPGMEVLFTQSQGISDLDSARIQAIPVEHLVADNEHATVILPTTGTTPLDDWTATLETYGLKVSTGPVVAFRARDYLHVQSTSDTVPLLWLQHIGQQQVRWPVKKKLEHVRATAETAWMFVSNAPMVLVRRFSPKEDLRRITCAPYEGQLPGAVLGLENHLNYIHRPNGRMSVDEVRGLSALLASSIIDRHFRAVAGSTQINATELRMLRLPSMSVIEAIGRKLPAHPTLSAIDLTVESELRLSDNIRKAA